MQDALQWAAIVALVAIVIHQDHRVERTWNLMGRLGGMLHRSCGLGKEVAEAMLSIAVDVEILKKGDRHGADR